MENIKNSFNNSIYLNIFAGYTQSKISLLIFKANLLCSTHVMQFGIKMMKIDKYTNISKCIQMSKDLMSGTNQYTKCDVILPKSSSEFPNPKSHVRCKF